ncbi:MAG TPA: CPBP family intramembrane glutamic endopeptidase [Candidatus Baltobacteraceae bacterium]|nr:CPBP family intramembrane glutamic endopeptidase [Candidatus Baltobacteraceae bacterium]
MSGRAVLLALLGFLGGTILVGWLTVALLTRFAPEWKAGDAPTVLIVAEAYVLLVVSLVIAAGGTKGVPTVLSFRFTGWRDIGLALAVWIGSLGLVCVLLALFSWSLGPLPRSLLAIVKDASDQSRLPAADALTTALIVIRALFLAPLGEELLFRGAFYGWLRKYAPAVITIISTSVLFAAVHYYPILMFAAFVIGIGAGWVRERTGSSLNFFVAHVFNSILFFAVAVTRL